jgi:hypothetical protein
MRRRRFPVVLSAKERRALQALASEDGLSCAAVVRRLIRREARQRGLWPSEAEGSGGQAQQQVV